MANLYPRKSGVLKTGELVITRSVGALILSSSKLVDAMTNETISMVIERPSGSNSHLMTKVSLRDVILSCLNQQGDAVIMGVHPEGDAMYMIELGNEAGILLRDGEKLKISLEGLISTDFYQIDYIEDYVNTTSHIAFESKSVGVGERDKSFDCSGAELVVIDNSNDAISEIGMIYSGTAERRYTPFELRALMAQMKEVHVLKDGGTMMIPNTKLIIPLLGVTSIRIYSTGAVATALTFMSYGELTPANNVRQIGKLPINAR